jgi:hypothetical protein
MNLHGSTTEIQNTLVQLYLKLEQRFNENALIRELWSGMAHDILQQMASLKSFPSSFWLQLSKDQDGKMDPEIQKAKLQINENTEDLPLKQCFETALRFEEPIILKIYVPIIRSLRKNWTITALDFYIMVKAHLARIIRVTESFSGDPITIQRSNLLQQSFEKEVQTPQEIVKPPEKTGKIQPLVHSIPKPEGKSGKALKKPVLKKQGSKRPSSKIAGVLAKHGKTHRNRTKPLAKDVGIRRRLANR